MLFSRRTALAAGFAAPFFVRSRHSAADSFAACRDRLAALFPNSLDAARALGGVCGEDCSAETLLDRLCETPGGRGQLASASPDELRAAIDAKIRADYRQGRTRRIEGWMLSETETRLFAIIAA